MTGAWAADPAGAYHWGNTRGGERQRHLVLVGRRDRATSPPAVVPAPRASPSARAAADGGGGVRDVNTGGHSGVSEASPVYPGALA